MNAELVIIEKTKQETETHIQIYYWDRQHINFLMDTTGITVENLNKTHVKMPRDYVKEAPLVDLINFYDGKIEGFLEELFSMYNNDEGSRRRNPFGHPECQKFIRENKTHTSMSVGDVIQINEKYFVCENEGWRELEKQKLEKT